MGTILKGMSRVRWHELTHAYGSAEGVPGRLSRVAWGDAVTSASALSDLGLWLGELSVFDATAEAVPFLWDLAVSDSVASRSGVIQLLRTILEQANPPRLDVQYAAHRAVLDGRSLADRLAGDGDVAVQTLAQDLVAAIDNHVCKACRPA
uniref:HEAT repeat domain-containing protein n=1 Tax=Streptomyces sp. NBC_01393 TaxID=2903851 RepID=A0AAU3I9L7_9ACTN